jgi:hypothetical protein
MPSLSRAVSVYTIYSADDNGFYCEVCDVVTGAELYSTRVYATEGDARRAAADPSAYRVPPPSTRGPNDRPLS